jgi:hypothetical protein
MRWCLVDVDDEKMCYMWCAGDLDALVSEICPVFPFVGGVEEFRAKA